MFEMGNTAFILLKFIKFCVVGVSGLSIDFSLTYLFKEKIKVNPFIANSVGFIIAASSNYLLNRFWTFESTNPDMGIEYFTFILISLIGLVINNSILYYFFKKKDVNFYLSKLFAIILTTSWNFTANFLITFG